MIGLIETLKSEGLSPNEYMCLALLKENPDELQRSFDKLRLEKLSLQYLYRKGFITNLDFEVMKNNKVTQKGKKVLGDITVYSGDGVNEFKEFWEAFPRNDEMPEFGIKGTRSLKTDKKYCKDYYKKLLIEGFTHKEIMRGLELELNHYRRLYEKTGENKLSFMKSSKSWLRHRQFEIVLEDPMYQEETTNNFETNI